MNTLDKVIKHLRFPAEKKPEAERTRTQLRKALKGVTPAGRGLVQRNLNVAKVYRKRHDVNSAWGILDSTHRMELSRLP